MTAYGRAALHLKRGRWTVEIASVNRKTLDLHLTLPTPLLFLDQTLRKWMKKEAHRGHVTVRVTCDFENISQLITLLKAQKTKWEEVAEKLHCSRDDITLSFLLDHLQPEEVIGDETALEKELKLVWTKACHAWSAMKSQEGAILVQDIQTRLQTMRKEIAAIEKLLPPLLKKHIAKLSARMKELQLEPSSEQLIKEAALQVIAADITEEIVRLKSHIEQLKSYLKSSEASIGKTLDFLAQEMGREIGTLMAKAGSSEIAAVAVRIKSEVEKIREQVQNLE